jgi:hypothetical protein
MDKVDIFLLDSQQLTIRGELMRYQSQELKKLESHNETFQRRVQDANKHWKLFLSELPIRKENNLCTPTKKLKKL